MHNDGEYWLSAALGVAMGALLMALLVNSLWRWDAIDHGYGRYNERTGRWEWKPSGTNSFESLNFGTKGNGAPLYSTNIVCQNYATNNPVTFDTRAPVNFSEWALVWGNWTNKPIGVYREVSNRIEQLPVQHDRPAPH